MKSKFNMYFILSDYRLHFSNITLLQDKYQNSSILRQKYGTHRAFESRPPESSAGESKHRAVTE